MSNTTSDASVSFASPTELAGFNPAELEAGLFAAALSYLDEWELDHPPLDAVLEALGVPRSRVVAAEAALRELLPAALPRPDEGVLSLTREVVDYLKANPGAVKVNSRRRSCSRCLRRFVLDLRERHAEVELEDVAHAVGVPQRTLVGWLRRARRG